MKRREILLVFVLIIFGIFYQILEDEDIKFFQSCSYDSRYLLDKNHAQKFVDKEYSIDDVNSVEIYNLAGSIKIQKINGTFSRISPEIQVYHRDKKKALEIRKDINILSNISNGKLKIEVQSTGRFPYRRVRVFFHLFLVKDIELNLFNRYGNVDINNVGKNISVDSKYGDIFIKNIESEINITHKYGRVNLSDIKGNTDLETRYSKVYSNNTRGLQIDGKHTKMKLSSIKGEVTLKNSHDYIDIQDAVGNINMRTNHCKIRLDRINSEYLVLQNRHEDVIVSSLNGKNIDISISHGDLNLKFDNIEERINISNKYSKVILGFSVTTNPFFNISLTYGKIKNYTPLELSILQSKYKQLFTSEEGNPKIVINNKYGDVVLRNTKEKTSL